MKKKLLSILVVLAMVVAMMPMTVFATDLPEGATWIVNEGDNHVWYKLEDSNSKLTIGGAGEMPNYSTGGSDAPWKNSKRNIKTVVIQTGVMRIGKNAFSSFSYLTSVTIPASVTSIGEDAFNGSFAANSTANLYIDDIASWCNVTFGNSSSNPYGTNRNIEVRNVYVGGSDTPVTELVIPDKVTSIPNYAFNKWKNLTSVTIPSSVTSIGISAFDSCEGLTSVTIPSSVTSIGNNAFQSCYLTSVIVKAATPPVLPSNSTLGYGASCVQTIYVPYEKVESYKSTNYWSSYKDRIKGAYLVDVVRAENGKVTVDKDYFPTNTYTVENKTVTVTVEANEGYQLKSLKYNDGTDHDITDDGSGYKFTMPKANVTVEAVFELKPQPHDVIAQVEDSHGKATVVDSDKKTVTEAVKDTALTFIATPNSGYEFDYWKVVSGGITLSDKDKVKSTLTVTMPDEALTLEAYFKASVPEIIKGNDQKVKTGTKEEVTFTSSAPFDTFEKVLVDGKEIKKDKDYTVKEGSTIVNLKPEYVATLKAGEHKVEIVSEGGTATAKLTITEEDAPETGDSNNMLLWSLLLALSIIGLGIGGYFKSLYREE